MKTTHFAFVCVCIAASLCAAQTAADLEGQAPHQSAQQPADAASQASQQKPVQPAPPNSTPEKDKGTDASGTSKDRLFFALPNFLTVENAATFPPLSAKQKFAVVGRSAFDPVQFAWYGFLSGISQAENSEPGFGQGWTAYGKRYGAYFADGTIENFMVGAILPSVFHQDPRFFQSGKGSFFHRTGYAVTRAVVTRTDSGHGQFNCSEVFGSALASAISTYSYHPRRAFRGYTTQNNVLVPVYWPSDRTLKNTASVWATQVGYDTLTFVIKEFWPDIRRKMKKHNSENK